MKSLTDIQNTVRLFANERDWDQFHSPKNLSMALAIETAEIMEHFQWLSEKQSKELPESIRDQVAEEIADAQMYLVRLADKLNINILTSVDKKIKKMLKNTRPTRCEEV